MVIGKASRDTLYFKLLYIPWRAFYNPKQAYQIWLSTDYVRWNYQGRRNECGNDKPVSQGWKI